MKIDINTADNTFCFCLKVVPKQKEMKERGYYISVFADILKNIPGKKLATYSLAYNFEKNYPKLADMVKLKRT